MPTAVTLNDYVPTVTAPLPDNTLVLLQRPGEILLAMKKVRFGAGKLNGMGGKVEPGETIRRAAVRETHEEIDVALAENELTQVAELEFYYPADPANRGMNSRVHVFTATRWQGTPTESEEMRPEWHAASAVPYGRMWPDDQHWLPLVLAGRFVRAQFLFGPDAASGTDIILDQNVQSQPLSVG